MSLKNKHLVVLACLIILALLFAHASRRQKTANAQNEANLQVQDVAFNAESALAQNESEPSVIQIPIPNREYQDNTQDSQENVLVQEGTLDEFVYLPIINNNFVYVFDDFSNPNSGFPLIDTSTNTYQYINGEYQILNKTDGYLGAVTVGHKLEEFEFAVSMRRVDSARGYYGLVYWLNDDWSNYYLFMVSPDTGETFQLHYTISTGFTLLSVSSPNSSVNLGNGVNRVGLKQYREWDGSYPEGLTTRFVINSSVVGSPAYSIPEGAFRVGFFAAPIDANHQVHFDDYLFKNYCLGSPGCSN